MNMTMATRADHCVVRWQNTGSHTNVVFQGHSFKGRCRKKGEKSYANIRGYPRGFSASSCFGSGRRRVVESRATDAGVCAGACGVGGRYTVRAHIVCVASADARHGSPTQSTCCTGEGRAARARGGAGRTFVRSSGTRDARTAVGAGVARVARACLFGGAHTRRV